MCINKVDKYKDWNNFWAVYKSGTGTRGQGHWDVTLGCVCGDMGLGDARRGTWGHQLWDAGMCGTGMRGSQKPGRRGHGMWMIITKVGGKCDISHFPREYVLVKATHLDLLRVPPCLFTKQSLGEDPLLWRKWNRCPRRLADRILEPKAGRVGCSRQNLCGITAFDSK